ncbi:MAG: hypothetical protein R3304_03560 [Longimicrobiales bacterium]|nr:hypothetical protein [Longimicrobiales bacterium]
MNTAAAALLSLPVLLGVMPGELVAAPLAPTPQLADTAFRHEAHSELSCLECHQMGSEHGSLLVRDAADCRGCHHVQERSGLECAACHTSADLRNVVPPMQRAVRLSVRQGPVQRTVRFDHADHTERACADCHAEGPSFAVPDLDCGSCHEEHHDPTVSECISCHVDVSSDDHPLDVHSTCSGSGCHADPPFDGPPRTRTGCLWCHQDMTDHEPDGRCVDCHFVTTLHAPSRSRSGGP